MYQPAQFKEQDHARLLRVMRENPFATLITPGAGNLSISHLPVLVREPAETNACPVLVSHMARANSHWKCFGDGVETTVVFHGPHCYVSPAWYEGRQHVPTWNYVTVHATGVARVIDDPKRVMDEMRALVHTFEGANGWHIDDAGAPFVEKLALGIVCFEIIAARFDGKFKLSQNRTAADSAGVRKALATAKDDQSLGVLRWMQELTAPTR